MKKQLLILSALAINLITFAQPTLTSSNSNPVIGDIFTIRGADWISEGSSGANQTWNFTSVTTTTIVKTYTCQNVNPGNTSTFPNANLEEGSTQNSTLFKTSSNALQYYGMVNGFGVINCSDPEDQMRYPFTMGDSYTDNFNGYNISGSNNFFHKGKTTVTADGYGTLILPTGTYSNVLRVHILQISKDSTASYEENYIYDQYQWYAPNYHMCIFGVYSYTIDNTAPIKWSNILLPSTTHLTQTAPNAKSIVLYPNPANGDFLNMDLNLEKNISYSLVITDNLGREVLNTEATDGIEGYNFRSVDISGIQSGLYQVALKSEGRTLKSTKIVVAK